jgi:hypothetical protein
MAGYNYTVEEAYSTNYLLNQEIYLGLARVMGDQLLLLTRFSYEYKNYSTPVARNDERVTGGVIVKYSVNPKFKIMADVKVDLLATDAFDSMLRTVASPDKPASYKAGSFGLGVMALF